MIRLIKTASLLTVFVLATGSAVIGQTPTTEPPEPMSDRWRSRDDQPRTIREQLIKQRIERERKEHLAMIRRGSDALELSEKLERSLNENNQFSQEDLKDLEELEKLVSRIRKDLGGGSDKEAEQRVEEEIGQKPDVKQAFQFLKQSTVTLVEELQKSTRFTISAAAIQTSNAIITVARFLRLRK